MHAKPLERWTVDLGNTRVKLGRHRGARLLEAHAFQAGARGDGLAFLLDQHAGTVALLSTADRAEEEMWVAALGRSADLWRYRPGAPLPFEVAYATPETLGTDRLAAVAGAHALYAGRPVLVIDVGTCITYEFLTAGAVYRGGVISPGTAMRLDAMHHFTGRLPRPAAVRPPSFPGDSTAAALQHGALTAAAHEIAGFAAAHRRDHPDGVVLGCGGGFAPLRPLLPADLEYRPHLVLEGLATMLAYASEQ